MLMTTTDGIEGRKIAEYLGIISGDAVVGANIFRDLFANVRDVVVGRAGGYEKALVSAKDAAMGISRHMPRRSAPMPWSASISTTNRSAIRC